MCESFVLLSKKREILNKNQDNCTKILYFSSSVHKYPPLKCPPQNVLLRMSFSECPPQNVLFGMSPSECPPKNVLLRISSSEYPPQKYPPQKCPLQKLDFLQEYVL